MLAGLDRGQETSERGDLQQSHFEWLLVCGKQRGLVKLAMGRCCFWILETKVGVGEDDDVLV